MKNTALKPFLLRKTQPKTTFAVKNKTKTKTIFSTLHVIFAGWNAHNFSSPSP
jgi:hypothetical protein